MSPTFVYYEKSNIQTIIKLECKHWGVEVGFVTFRLGVWTNQMLLRLSQLPDPRLLAPRSSSLRSVYDEPLSSYVSRNGRLYSWCMYTWVAFVETLGTSASI